VSGTYLNPPVLGMTLNKNVLKNIGGEITDGILLNGDAQKIKIITGGEITCPPSRLIVLFFLILFFTSSFENKYCKIKWNY
jgi:hypothetical protein